MPITKPQLPPKAGYVEVEVDGERTYKNVKTGAFIGADASPTPEPMTTEELILDKLTELEYRQDLAALGLGEGGIL